MTEDEFEALVGTLDPAVQDALRYLLARVKRK